jgi:hypothetical protein
MGVTLKKIYSYGLLSCSNSIICFWFYC